MASIASIQLTSGPNIQANLLEVSKYLEEISKGKSKLVVLPENFAFTGNPFFMNGAKFSGIFRSE